MNKNQDSEEKISELGTGALLTAADTNYQDLVRARSVLIEKIPTKAPIFLPTDRIDIENQVAGLSRVLQIYQNDLDLIYRPKLRALRDKYHGRERCFVIGNGPSLNKTDLSKLSNEVTFAVNGFFLKTVELQWQPTFYVVEDHLVAEDRRDAIENIRGPIKLFPAYLGYCFTKSDDTIFFNHRPRKSYPTGFDFSTDAADITYTGCTVTFTCLQLAYYFGFKKIYLVGVDADYAIPKDATQSREYGVEVIDMKSDDPNHFHPDYFGKGFRWHDPQVDKMIEAYAMARTVTQQCGIDIFNATVGGKLEVFPRVDFLSLFTQRQGETQKNELPRTLIIDLTAIGNATATGEIKQLYFSQFNQSTLLHVFSLNGKAGLCRGPDPSESDCFDWTSGTIIDRIRQFNPQVILYRPLPDNLELHQLAMYLFRTLLSPWVIWMMDDWPERLRLRDANLYLQMKMDLEELLRGAVARLAISEYMAREYRTRYGVDFEVFHNGIRPHDWLKSPPPKSTDGLLRVRFSGSLAVDSARDSVYDIAVALETLAKTYPLIFEIHTQSTWVKTESKRYESLSHVELQTACYSRDEYYKWLRCADLLVLAYNFDSDTKRYLALSFANKVPEYLASGAPVIAYGPRQIATIDYLAREQLAEIVDTRDQTKLVESLTRLLSDPTLRARLAIKGQSFATSKLTLAPQIERFSKILYAASTLPPIQLTNLDSIPPYERSLKAHIDETKLIGDLIERSGPDNVMIDVGAHWGESAAHFIEKGWRVFCFEPDEKNYTRLEKRFSDTHSVTIDRRAVGETVEGGKPFFSSQESSGVSGLSAFLDTHHQVGLVDVTTIQQIVAQHGIKKIDFLKIDVEGFDFSVLKGVPWDEIQPRVIECEFEDAKTQPMGHSWRDIAEFLTVRGYTVFVSEWHPIIRYGIRHEWRSLRSYPCDLHNSDSWGNLIAFKDPISNTKIISTLHQHISSAVIGSRSYNIFTKSSDRASPRPTARTPNAKMAGPFFSFSRDLATYPAFAEWLQRSFPTVFPMARAVIRALRKARKSPLLAALVAGPITVSITAFALLLNAPSHTYWPWLSVLVLLLAGTATGGLFFGIKHWYRFKYFEQSTTKALLDERAKLSVIEKELKTITREHSLEVEKLQTALSMLNRDPDIQRAQYQPFNRVLTDLHVETILQSWNEKLGLHTSKQALFYIAERICHLERICRGRLATPIENALLRVLVAAATKSQKLSVLEIGTLFGIGLAAIYDHMRPRREDVKIVAIDPLDGYYGKDILDVVTDEPINEYVFFNNLAAVGVQKCDLELIKLLSNDASAIERAGERAHDLLIIDGDHSFDGVRNDFNNYLRSVKDNGFIIFDDYGSPEWPGVKQFVDTMVIGRMDLVFLGASWRSAVFRVNRHCA